MTEQHIDSKTVSELFVSTYKQSNTAIVKQAEKTLQQLSNSLLFSTVLFDILSSNEHSKQLKNSVVIYIKKLSYQYTKKSDVTKINKLLEICWLITIGDYTLNFKKQASMAIEVIIKYNAKYLSEIIEIINKSLNEIVVQINIYKIEGIALLAKSFLNFQQQSLQKIGIVILNILTQFYSKLLLSVSQVLNHEDDNILNRRIQVVLQINYLLIKHLMIGNFVKIPDYMIIISKQSLADNLWQILQFPIPNKYVQNLQKTIVPPSFNSFNYLKRTTINIITKIMLKLHYLSVEFGGENIMKAISDNPIFKEIGNKVQVLKFIIPIVSQNNIEKMPKSAVLLIQTTLNLLTLLLMNPKFQQFFSINKTQFISKVTLPLLQLNSLQKQDYESDPEEFINYLGFSMPPPFQPKPPSQKSEQLSIAGYAAQFLKAYCTFQHGTLIELFNTCSDNYVKGNQKQKQLSVIIFSVLLHEVMNRDNLMQVINALVTNSVQQFGKVEENKYLKSLKLYLSYRYLVKFAVDYQETATLLLKLSLGILTNQVDKNECLELLAIQIIKDMMNYGPIMTNSFQDVLQVLISMLNKDSHPKIIDLVNQIISQFFDEPKFNNGKLVISIVHELVLRVNKQNTASTVNVQISNKCWNTIRTITDNQKFIPSLVLELEVEISQLYYFLENINNINFDQDIILILQSFVKHSKAVTQKQFRLLQYFKPIFIKNSNRMGQIYLPINYMITYGAHLFASHPQTIIYLLDICEISITTPLSQKVGETEHLQGIVSLQSLIVSCGDWLNVQIITKILFLLFTRLNQKSQLQEVSQNIINCLALILPKAIKLIKDPNIQLTLTKVLSNPPVSGRSIYIMKTYIISLCQIIRLPEYDIIRNKYVNILNQIVQTFQLLQMTKDEINSPDDQVQQEHYQYQLFIERQLINQLTLADQYDILKQTLQFLNQNHGQIFNSTIQKLTKDKLDFLKTINNVVSIDQKPRQIIKVKRG